jgi:hypothetical protein
MSTKKYGFCTDACSYARAILDWTEAREYRVRQERKGQKEKRKGEKSKKG